MKHVQFSGLLALTVITACNTTPVQNAPMPTRVLGNVELSLDSAGVSSLRFANRVSTLREADVVFGTGTTQVITSTLDPYNYLVATFPVSHAVSSTTAFSNLTLYAEVLFGNIGSTAIKTITNFGGVTNTAEQARLAKLVVPVHAVTTDVPGHIVLDNAKADFQAFTGSEVTTAKNLAVAGSAMTVSDNLLNYGFSARCNTSIAANCTANSRIIALGKTGFVTLALRVPKSASAYKFLMNFVVMDESVSRVTRSVFPLEDNGDAEVRANTLVGASEMMMFGLNRYTSSLSTNLTVDDVSTSSLNGSIFALGLGRISAGDSHSCGLDATGSAYCWGNNSTGQLGNGTSGGSSNVPVAVSTTIKFSSVVAGRIHTCGLSVAGDAYCWGSNFVGSLGDGSGLDSLTPSAVTAPSVGIQYSSISASNDHTCVISLAKDAYCWGENGTGQLGDNSIIQRNTPVKVSDPVSGPEAYSSISAGYSHTCAIAANGKTYCWGENADGELGDAGNIDSSIPVLVNTGVVAYTSIAAGNNFSCGIQANGSAYCWGSNGNGNLGDNTINDSNTPVLVNDPIAGAVKYSSIVAGGFHTCATSLAGDAYCWGYNFDGELGDGANSNIEIPTLVSPPTGGAVLYSGLDVGTFHSCAISTTGNAYCWGFGSNGRLGYNSAVSVNIPTRDGATSLTL
jgi:alpha-tubulin suppressor-like RCC1 family protein